MIRLAAVSFYLILWYDGRTDVMEERRICETKFVKSCQPVTVTDCMQVSELHCEVATMKMMIWMILKRTNHMFDTDDLNKAMDDRI